MRIIRELNNNPGIDYPNGSRFGIYEFDNDIIIGFVGEGRYGQIEYRGVVIKEGAYKFGYNNRYWSEDSCHGELKSISIPTKEKLIYYSKTSRKLLIILPSSIIFIRKNHIIEYLNKLGSRDYLGHQDTSKPLIVNGHLYKRVEKETIEFKITN